MAKKTELEKIVEKLIEISEEKKATDIRHYQLHEPYITDFALVISAGNSIHCKALKTAFEKELKTLLDGKTSADLYEEPKVSGNIESGWIILDLNAILIHIVCEDIRDHYGLDALFESRAIVYHH